MITAEQLVIEKLRELNSKIQFEGLRCSDNLPCTAYTCTQDWCKFPERKVKAKNNSPVNGKVGSKQ